MWKYEKELIKEGIAETRTYELTVALDMLHTAISKLDGKNKTIFFSKGMLERLNDFAEIEQLSKI